MEITEIEFKAFRSLINQSLHFNERCTALIGLNESGKSNILDAIRSLDKKKIFSLRDKSKINNALPVVNFYFKFTNEEKDEIRAYLNSFIDPISHTPANEVITSISMNKVQISKTYEKSEKEFKKFSRSENDLEIKVKGGFSWIQKPATIPADVTILNDELKLNQYNIIWHEMIPDPYKDKYTELTGEILKSYFLKEINEKIDEYIPSVIFWEYENKYLVPSEITYDDFLLNDTPYNNSIPLYNIFLLTKGLNIDDADDLIEKIKEWKSDSSARRRDSAKINEGLNKYIKNIWQDYDQELYIELEETKITIHINDPNSPIKNFYEMEDRSQGFKTFISFILTIAAEAETNTVSNFLLLLDEPETHLHPSGVKFMKHELLKLASLTNYVVYATHSIFLIDRENLRRHVLVKKENEQTSLTTVDKNNIMQEAIIYEALGTTIDEFSIGMRNIVFEGELDIQIFKFLIEKCLKKKDNLLLEYNLLDGGGTKRIIKFFKDKVIPVGSNWHLVLDNDSPGKKVSENISDIYAESVQKQFSFHFYSEKNNYELEDILPKEIVFKSISDTVESLKFEKSIRFSGKDYQSDKVISGIINEFKNKNKIEGNISNQFESSFKQKLSINIGQLLEQIEKESSINKKREAFKTKLPEYYIFFEQVINKFNLKVSEDDGLVNLK